MNRPGFVLWVAIASTILFFVTAWITMPTYGALGANFAHIAFAALTAIAMDIAMWRQIGQTMKETKE
jgi:O-antigen/teichoic acid export membrane protein